MSPFVTKEGVSALPFPALPCPCSYEPLAPLCALSSEGGLALERCKQHSKAERWRGKLPLALFAHQQRRGGAALAKKGKGFLSCCLLAVEYNK